MNAYIQTSTLRPDGRREAFCTVAVPAKVRELPWQAAGLQFTASGYGRRIPTRYVVRWGSRWRRVYCCRVSNAGTLYIGRLADAVYVSGLQEGEA